MFPNSSRFLNPRSSAFLLGLGDLSLPMRTLVLSWLPGFAERLEEPLERFHGGALRATYLDGFETDATKAGVSPTVESGDVGAFTPTPPG